jgi:methyl-accepting chemotaxis protein
MLNHLQQNNLNKKEALPVTGSSSDYYGSASNIVKSIVEITKKIKVVTDNSEQDFLQIGSKLQKFLSNSKELNQISSSLVSSAAEEVLKNGITELADLLNQFTELLAKSNEDIKNDKEELKKIKSNIDLIISQMGNFNKIVKRFRMLGISIKIESSRLASDEGDFTTLAESVENLSEQISSKASTISVKSNMLFQQIEKAVKDLEKLEAKQSYHSELILGQTTNTLNTFRQNYKKTYEETNKIALSSNNVSNSINDIVISLQSHDITRQKLEHVLEALNKFIEVQENSDNSDSKNNSQIDLSMVHDVCELQALHLKNSKEEFVSAVVDIISNLRNVEENIGSIFNEMTTLLGEDSVFRGKSIVQAHNEFNSISNQLVLSTAISDEIASTTRSIVDIIDDLSKYVLEIEGVGTEIEIVALNARVKAARSGSNGSALDVLAEAIQNLSVESKNYTGSTSAILLSISRISQKLKINTDSGEENSFKNNIDKTMAKINLILDSFTNIEVNAGNVMTNLQQKVCSLKDDISYTINGILIHKQVEEIINKTIEELLLIIQSLKNNAAINSDRMQNTSGLTKKYTMHSEREIHQDFLGVNPIKKIEKVKSIKNPENSFGDNVDLF